MCKVDDYILATKSSSFQQITNIHKLQYYKLKNSRTFKDLETRIQGLSRTNPVFKALNLEKKNSRT